MSVSSRSSTISLRGRELVSTAVAIVGWALLLGGLGYLIAELFDAYMTGTYQVISAGQTWFDLDVASLNLVQAVIQRYLHPFLWDPIISSILQWPVWSLLGGVGAFLALAFPLRGGK